LEDRAATQLRAQTLDALAQEPGSGFEALSPFLVNKDLQLDATLAEMVRQRDRLSLSPDSPSLIHAFGLDRPAPDLARALDAQTLTALIEGIAAAGGKKAQAALPALQALRAGANDALPQLQPHFTRGDGEAKTHQIATKSLTAVVSEAEAQILAVAEAVSGALEHQNAQRALAQTQALLHFAQHFITAYDARKRAHGVLEFDDMIRATDRLLNRAEVADWVRYRLDGGIHHILVDEAQDTSPAQWRVIDALTQEFFAGAGSTTAPRTVFVVGDRKQSIYSFQGADPVAFGAQETRYADALTDIDDTLERCDLLHSFRSSEPILQLVDQVFLDIPEISATHVAFKTDLPGRVELWPWTEKAEEAPPKPWSDPVDQERPGNATLLLAAEVADWLAGHLANQTSLPGTGRALSAGDVLILVRSRGPLFRGLLSALKAAGVPVAGADRLKVNDQLIVKDLLGLLCAVATEADDLNLAAALRSPLFGLSEQDLFTLAHDREASLTQALAAAADRHPEAWALLSDLRASADYLRPFELLSRTLTRHGTAPRIEARMGAEAVEAVDELLNLALEYEQVEPPTLTGFLEWMQAGNPDVKRQLDPKSG
ncbi:MAG: UvrD-helicase domain-containing protein, partial [Pseudomonadota bacterium]